MGLAKYQRKALEHHKEIAKNMFDRIWGLLPPSPERDKIMYNLGEARITMDRMLKEPEQMTMEEILDEDN